MSDWEVMTPTPLDSTRTYRHRQEGFLEVLELRPDGTFRIVCDYHVIHGGQWDEDDYTDTYDGVYRYHAIAGAGGVLVLELRRGERTVLGRTFVYDLVPQPPQLLALLDARGDMTALEHIATPRGVVPTIEAEREFFAATRRRDRFVCPCQCHDEHVLRPVD